MRKIQQTAIFVFLGMVVFAQKPNPGFFDKMVFFEKNSYVKKMNFVESNDYAATDIVYQRMEWNIDPAVNYIEGKVTSYIKSKVSSLSELQFDLHSKMKVDSVTWQGEKIGFSRIQDKLNILFPIPVTQNQLDSVAVFYQGKPESSGFGSFFQSTHNNVPIVWTLSEPYGAMEWWPCKQSLADKIDSIDVIVTTPQAYRTASNGVLVSEKTEKNKRTMHWKHRYPIATYLVAIAVTNYSDYSDFLTLSDGRKIEILNFVYPENLENAKNKTPVTTDIMALFNELIGEYPFANEKYGHAQFGWGGGMEHQTMSFMYNFNFELVAHELAHQWFGDYITLGSWQEIWLNEGFATYLAGLCYENLLDGVWWPVWKKANIERIVRDPGGSVFVEDTTNVSRIFDGRLSYSKGAYLLHMLRWVLGDQPFFTAVKNYFNDPKVANGFARNKNLVFHLENAGDTALTEFFNDWFYGEGYPLFSARFAQLGNETLKFYLSQQPSHPSVGFFEMPVQVRMYNAGKTDSIDFRLNHTENNQEFVLYPGFEVDEISIDPDRWLVSLTREITKIPWLETSDEFVIYPNPVLKKLTVFVPEGELLRKTSLINSKGQVLMEWAGSENSFNLSGVANGIYILVIETDKAVIEKKIVKYN